MQALKEVEGERDRLEENSSELKDELDDLEDHLDELREKRHKWGRRYKRLYGQVEDTADFANKNGSRLTLRLRAVLDFTSLRTRVKPGVRSGSFYHSKTVLFAVKEQDHSSQFPD